MYKNLNHVDCMFIIQRIRIFVLIKYFLLESCRFEQRKKKILSNISLDRKTSPYRRSILTNNYQPGVLLRTPTTSPESMKNQ